MVRRQQPGADRRPVDRPADRRVPGVLREHAAAAARGAERQQHPAVPPGPLGHAGHVPHARHPAVPRRPGLRRRLEGLRRRGPPDRTPHRRRRRRPGCSTGWPSTSAPGTSSASRCSSPAQFDAGGGAAAWTPGTATAPPGPGIQQGWVDRGVRNPVVLTGDVHTAWANDLKADYANPESRDHRHRAGRTSITSGGNGTGPHRQRRRAAGREPAHQVRERPAGLHPRAGSSPGCSRPTSGRCPTCPVPGLRSRHGRRTSWRTGTRGSCAA